MSNSLVKAAVEGVMALRRGSEAKNLVRSKRSCGVKSEARRTRREFQREFQQYASGEDPSGRMDMEGVLNLFY